MKNFRILATGVALTAAAFLVGQNGAGADEGHVTEAGEYVVVGQYRALDTRNGQRVLAGNAPEVQTGYDRLDSDEWVQAVAVHITVTNPSAAGYVTVWDDGPRPNTSVLVVDEAGDSETTYAVVPIDAHGSFRVFVSMDADVIVDIVGYVSAGPNPFI
jgi:hypothetical protein